MSVPDFFFREGDEATDRGHGEDATNSNVHEVEPAVDAPKGVHGSSVLACSSSIAGPSMYFRLLGKDYHVRDKIIEQIGEVIRLIFPHYAETTTTTRTLMTSCIHPIRKPDHFFFFLFCFFDGAEFNIFHV